MAALGGVLGLRANRSNTADAWTFDAEALIGCRPNLGGSSSHAGEPVPQARETRDRLEERDAFSFAPLAIICRASRWATYELLPPSDRPTDAVWAD